MSKTSDNRLPRLLIQFAKTPEPGKVKTRLQPEYSAQQACDLHCQLVQLTAGLLKRSAADKKQLHVAGDLQHPFWRFAADAGLELKIQQAGDLGEKMRTALNTGLEQFSAVVLVGSDCPALTPEVLEQAFRQLENGDDLVLNPAEDGGYVLIGCSRYLEPALFDGVRWGGDQVLARTSANAEVMGLKLGLLAELWDVDYAGDVRRWQQLLPAAQPCC